MVSPSQEPSININHISPKEVITTPKSKTDEKVQSTKESVSANPEDFEAALEKKESTPLNVTITHISPKDGVDVVTTPQPKTDEKIQSAAEGFNFNPLDFEMGFDAGDEVPANVNPTHISPKRGVELETTPTANTAPPAANLEEDFDSIFRAFDLKEDLDSVSRKSDLGKGVDTNTTIEQASKSLEIEVVNALFNKQTSSLKPFETSKLSRKELGFENSYIFINLGQKKSKDGHPMFTTENLPLYDIRTYKFVHGKSGILGEGGWKTAKQMIELGKVGEKLVKAKFKDYTPEEIDLCNKKMLAILTELKNEPYVAAGHYTTITSYQKTLKKGSPVSTAVILSNFAKTDLRKAIKNGGISAEDKIAFALHLVKGLKNIHDKGIAHCDVKPENINIIEIDGKDVAHHADFDIARKEDSEEGEGKYVFTPNYRAPEIWDKNNKIVSFKELQKGDVYALGVTLYELHFEKGHPWWPQYDSIGNMNETEFEKLYFLDHGIKLPKEESIELIIRDMMHPDSTKRASLANVIERLEKLT